MPGFLTKSGIFSHLIGLFVQFGKFRLKPGRKILSI